jgi:hypothetical protein
MKPKYARDTSNRWRRKARKYLVRRAGKAGAGEEYRESSRKIAATWYTIQAFESYTLRIPRSLRRVAKVCEMKVGDL